ncbi:uncharacterized protein LOC133901294 [Phragmites australis]|uniref:uncharacterized protein LOC133901294 n=1 Tax=Phragmites australis TaxID=29695 RepID=UPI002D7943B2|nr:uncharacterized protein LOC133901294 [Phragmites australis]
MEFASRGPDTAAAADDDGRRFPEPPPHEDAMLVIRDALLSQLQKDRLRQEIIVAELAKIEQAMALCSTPHHGIVTADAERAKPVSFAQAVALRSASASHHAIASADAEQATLVPFPVTDEQFMQHSRGAVGPEHCVGVDEIHDMKNHGVHRGGELKSEKPAMEDLVSKCLKTSGSTSTGKAVVQNNAALDECKIQESNEAILPKKTSPSVKWSCAICQVEAPSEGHIQQHFAGQKHRSTVATLVSRNNAMGLKAKATAEKSRNARQYAEKPRPKWVCRFCQSNCTCKSDLENHQKGKRHKAKIQALLEECENITKNYALWEAKSDPNTVQQNSENPASAWNCSLCQAKCTCQSDLENHLRGKRHQLNFLVLQVESMQYENVPRRKIEDLLRDRKNAKSNNLKTAKKLPSDGSNSKGASSDMEVQGTLYFCKLCNLQCNSKNTLAEHRKGKKHSEKVEKRMLMSFCEICIIQCNSEKNARPPSYWEEASGKAQ